VAIRLDGEAAPRILRVGEQPVSPIAEIDAVMQDAGTETPRQVFYSIAVSVFVYGWMSVNIYLPVLPQLEHVFDTTTTTARLTVTIFLIGFAFTQLVWGPLSDRFGRKPTLLTGLAISVAGAALAAVSNDIYVFAAARFLESIGLGVGPVVGRAVLTDVFDRAHVAIAMAYTAIVVAVVPAIAPIVGGYLDLFLSWRGIFVFLALYGTTLVLVCSLRLPETNKNPQSEVDAVHVISEIREILSEPRYLGYVLVYGIAFGGLVGYYAAAPFIFVGDLGYSAHVYGYLLILTSPSMCSALRSRGWPSPGSAPTCRSCLPSSHTPSQPRSWLS